MIRSEKLANQATLADENGKEFLYDHVTSFLFYPFDEKSRIINIKVDSQRRSMKGILFLFVEPYSKGARDSENFVFPDLKKVTVTINGSPTMLYNNGIESRDAWRQVSRFFMKEKHKPHHMTLQKFFAEDKFGLLIDLRSMASQEMHWSGTRLVNTTDGVQLQIKREAIGSGAINCHVFIISDAQFDILDRQLHSVLH